MAKNLFLPQQIVDQKLNRTLLQEYNFVIRDKIRNLYRENTEEYIIQDGPPYANGDLHLGHFLNKTLKDVLAKYLLSNGKKVRFSFGWDCHGLPIENKAKEQDGDLLANCNNIALYYYYYQKQTLKKYGIYNTEPDYLTLDNKFIEREIDIFKNLQKQGYIFFDEKPVWYSPYLQTVLANSEIEYKKIQDESVYFKLKIDYTKSFLVWTTTEWTISGNQAVCLNKNIEYVVTKEGFVCSKRFAIEQNFSYEPFDITLLSKYFNTNDQLCPVLFDNSVSDTKTGIVHLCGGHGDVDFEILKKNNIRPKNVVNHESDFLPHLKNYILPEEFVFKREVIEHDYPVDWRIGEKVYKFLTMQQYVKLDFGKIKEQLKSIKISGKDRKRLESMIFSRKDWCISRQRKWGVKIPHHDDILDVWFDSGTVFSMYDKPADIYIEGSDQHRGWFQTSVILSSLIGKQCTKKIFTHGFIVDEDKKDKLSKSKGNNVLSLDALYEQYSPDVLRLWVLLADYRNEIVFSTESLNSVVKQYFKIRNYLRYFINNLYRKEFHREFYHNDIMDKIETLQEKVGQGILEINYSFAIREYINFLVQYSSRLTEALKNEFYESAIDSSIRIKLENEFYYMSKNLIHILFPLLPFLSVELEEKMKIIEIYGIQ